jgi:small subunit ribosomal protein S4
MVHVLKNQEEYKETKNMIIKTKYKLCRRLGVGLFEKCQTQKFTLSEAKRNSGKKKFRRRKMVSEYGAQLIEKQKLRFAYGLREKQLSRYVRETMSKKDSNIAQGLYIRLETRLDNVVYKLGLGSTRAMSRQIVSHGHILLNGKKVTVASCEVKVGDVISIRKGSENKMIFAELKGKGKNAASVIWLNFNLAKKEGKMIGLPKLESQGVFDFKSILEFYGR